MSTLDFNFIFLGQSVLRYEVPLDIYHTINQIYESKYPQLKPANKQLVGKIEKEHSLFYSGEDTSKMTQHNHLPADVLGWFQKMFVHYSTPLFLIGLYSTSMFAASVLLHPGPLNGYTQCLMS